MLFARFTGLLIASLVAILLLGGCEGPPRYNPKDNPNLALTNLKNESQVSKLAWAQASVSGQFAPNRRDRFQRTPLMIAAAYGDPQLISKMIDFGIDVDAMDSANNTALIYAAAYGNTEGIKALLKANPNLEVKGKNKQTALHVAASAPGSNADCVRVLIEAGCAINALIFIDQSPIVSAIDKTSDLARLRLLLKHNNDDEDGIASLQRLNYALFDAASENRVDAIKILLDSGADIQTEYKWLGTPLHAAARRGNIKTIQMLIQAGADLESHSNSNGFTPLIDAARDGSAETIQTLIDLGADTNGRDDAGMTALMHVASTQIYPSSVYDKQLKDVYARMDALIASAADLEASDKQGRTALFHSMSKSSSYKDVRISRLIDAGASVNATDKEGVTILMHALRKQRGNVIASLLEHGAKVRVRDHQGRTALMRAAKYGTWGSPNIINLLLDAGADIDAIDKNGWSALAHAAENLQRGSIESLIQYGARPSSIGWTPLHLAIVRDRQMGALITPESGIDLDAHDMWGRTALHCASRFNDHTYIIRILNKAGANIESKNNDGKTPLMQAVLGYNREVIKTLLELGAQINSTDNYGMTALMHATKRESSFLVEDLLNYGADTKMIDIQGLSTLDHAKKIVSDYSRRRTLKLIKAHHIDNDG